MGGSAHRLSNQQRCTPNSPKHRVSWPSHMHRAHMQAQYKRKETTSALLWTDGAHQKSVITGEHTRSAMRRRRNPTTSKHLPEAESIPNTQSNRLLGPWQVRVVDLTGQGRRHKPLQESWALSARLRHGRAGPQIANTPRTDDEATTKRCRKDDEKTPSIRRRGDEETKRRRQRRRMHTTHTEVNR